MPVIEPTIDDYERADINEHIARLLRDLGNPEPPSPSRNRTRTAATGSHVLQQVGYQLAR